ncbi:MAG: lactonase family protein [Planctomycetaceae bacterium]
MNLLRRFAWSVCCVCGFSTMVWAADAPSGKQRVYFGTYTGKSSKGIYRSELDLATGQLSPPVLAGEAASPSFLAIAPNQKFLYAVGELNDVNGKKGGAVNAFAIDAATGDLKLLNQQSSVGGGPCHISVDRSGKNALVANYGGGSTAVLPIQADGKLGEASSFVQHKGYDSVKDRPLTPHAHSINVDAANRFAIVADLGLDQVLVYKLDVDKGTITANDPPAANVEPGSGPRHFAFHPNGKSAYVINERVMTVTAFQYDADKGVLTPHQTITTLPEGVTDRKGMSTAEVQVHPSGKFLYGSNRGHHSIAIFSIDSATGKLTAVGHQGQGIKTPRNFGIDPTGNYLLVANQDGDSVIVFRVHPASGELVPTGSTITVASPVCVKFLPLVK